MGYAPRHRTLALPRRKSRVAMLAASAAVAVSIPATTSLTNAGAATTRTWERLAQCESGGNWHINTGNGYYGGLQFSYSTWLGFGGGKFAQRADLASKSEQIRIAEKVLKSQGWGAWPACSAALGLDHGDAVADDDVTYVTKIRYVKGSRKAQVASKVKPKKVYGKITLR